MTVHNQVVGNFFEDFHIGDVYLHKPARTISTADNIWFTLLTQNTAPLHFDHVYAAKTVFGRPLVNSALTLSIVAGQSVRDISQNVFANLKWTEVVLPAPVFEGDTVSSSSRILAARESASRPEAGVLTVETTGSTQSEEMVIRFERTLLVYRRGFGPQYGMDSARTDTGARQ
jgi:acyl dehydratase